VLAPGDGEDGGGVDGLGWVEVGPPGGEVELAGGGRVLGGPGRADRGEQTGGTEVVVDLCPCLWPCFAFIDHVFDSTVAHRQSATLGCPETIKIRVS